jgi:hypothetical protein
MARLDVKATVTAPSEINIPLVRGDHHEVSGVFRVCFEVALSVFSTLFGYVLSLSTPEKFHWLALTVAFLAMGSFLYLSHSYSKKSKVT